MNAEIWGIEGYGAGYILQELLTIKSDDLIGRYQAYQMIVSQTGANLPRPSLPESFKVLTRELKALCINLTLQDES